jgi:hypothetical protein
LNSKGSEEPLILKGGRMRGLTKVGMIVGVIFLNLMVCLSYLLVCEGRASVSFTYTAPVTQKSVCVGDTTEFTSTLKNTGTQSDTYDVDKIEKPPTPVGWWLRFCAGGVCYDSNTIHAEVSLDPNESTDILLDILPRTAGTGNVTMRITSQANPSLKDSITFVLNTQEPCPVTNQWGLVTLMVLILGSGFYLIFRKLKLSNVT